MVFRESQVYVILCDACHSQMSAAFNNASMWEKMQDIQKQETTFRVKKREMETKIKDLSNQVR